MDNKEKMVSAFNNLQTVKKELISSYEEGYIGKKTYKVTLNDGSSRMCEQITKNKGNGDAVVIVPITEDGNFVMIVESRPNTKETVVLEFPAGMVDEGEDAKVAAIRELLEETGYQPNNVYELEWHYQDQGCSSAIIRTYVAEGCKKVQEKSESDDERLEYLEMTYEDILTYIKNPSMTEGIKDANTKIAFMEYILRKKGIYDE